MFLSEASVGRTGARSADHREALTPPQPASPLERFAASLAGLSPVADLPRDRREADADRPTVRALSTASWSPR